MLLTQVCSLHDATPRTFVVHVIALYERGILDADAINFLFDLGLVPRGHGWDKLGDAGAVDVQITEVEDEGEGVDDGRGEESRGCQSCVVCAKELTRGEESIVPYRAEANGKWASDETDFNKQHQRRQEQQSISSNSYSNGGSSRSQNMSHRQTQAFAIRKHLERHESLSSGRSSANIFGGSSVATRSSATLRRQGTSSGETRPANLTLAQRSLASAEESVDTPSFRRAPNHHHETSSAKPPQPPHISAAAAAAASWSVEHHPLSLSRYRRDFHELDLLAAGSFGSVYRALHKLEQRPYAIKGKAALLVISFVFVVRSTLFSLMCSVGPVVTFRTTGYYADTLALVTREVRCLAQVTS